MAAEWTVERSAAAKDDVLAIWDYLADYDEAVADRFVRSVEKAIWRLSEFPRLGATREHLPVDIRVISFKPYLLLYRIFVEERRIEIVRVVDGRRDLASLDLAP